MNIYSLPGALNKMKINDVSWLDKIKSAEKTCFVRDGKRSVHYKFPTGEEMAEEYNLQTNILVRRAWKNKKNMTKPDDWTIEVGDPEPKPSNEVLEIRENSNSPYVIKRITKTNLEWRIRNLPYPVETYQVTASPEEDCIVVRTTNKKYFKKIRVEELERTNLKPNQSNIEFTHKFNSLIITYKKPAQVLKLERDVIEELKNAKDIDQGGVPGCNPS